LHPEYVGGLALARWRYRLRSGFVIIDKTEFRRPQAISCAAFLFLSGKGFSLGL
jgi:hypothetical protein